jgi:hypothetical protein
MNGLASRADPLALGAHHHLQDPHRDKQQDGREEDGRQRIIEKSIHTHFPDTATLSMPGEQYAIIDAPDVSNAGKRELNRQDAKNAKGRGVFQRYRKQSLGRMKRATRNSNEKDSS